MSASFITPGKQTFVDENGFPLVSGTIGMYIPSTLVPKNTWQNVAQTVLNTDPIILDARGQCIIFGIGTYRQILRDSLGNLIWDQLVYAISGGGGGQGGLTKTITYAMSPYTLLTTDGVLLCDVSGGAITINLLAATAYGAELSIKIKGIVTNQVTVVPNGTDTIDAATSYPIAFDNESITIVSDLVSYWGVI